jgi:hypothetical protein
MSPPTRTEEKETRKYRMFGISTSLMCSPFYLWLDQLRFRISRQISFAGRRDLRLGAIGFAKPSINKITLVKREFSSSRATIAEACKCLQSKRQTA